MSNQSIRLGFIGLGEMGLQMVRNLVQAGYQPLVYDLSAVRMQECESLGAVGATSSVEVVTLCQIVMTCLPSSESWVVLAETTLVPHAIPKQTFIDFGTVVPSETRRIAAALAAAGAALLDTPVSGGPQGVQNRDLYMFVGGEQAVFLEHRALLEAIGGSSKITYCGPVGSGQVVKGVNQLMMGLVAAAYTETVAFGVRSGVDAETIRAAIGDTECLRQGLSAIAARAAAGDAEHIGIKFRELPYYIREAELQRFALPITAALHVFCATGERVVVDDHRPAPSFWHELMRESTEAGDVSL